MTCSELKVGDYILIRVNDEEVKRLRYERGKADAKAGYPPTDPSPDYRAGYAAGRGDANDT